MKYYYKIMDKDEKGRYKTLFHGLNGSKVLMPDKWYTAEKKMVSDGKGTEYLSGFHVLPTSDECVEYLVKFKNLNDKVIVKCQCQKLRKKEHSNSNVYLADKIKLIE
jgi:hypothetical protein